MIPAKFAACDVTPLLEKGCTHTRTNKKPSNRKLEALLSLFEMAPDAQHLEVLFRVALRLPKWHNVVNLCLPPISTDSPTVPTLPVVSDKHSESD